MKRAGRPLEDPLLESPEGPLISFDEGKFRRLIEVGVANGVRVALEEIPVPYGVSPQHALDVESYGLMIVGHEVIIPRFNGHEPILKAVKPFSKVRVAADDVSCHQLTKLTLWKAAELGMTADEVIEILKVHSRSPPRAALRNWISRTMSTYGALTIVGEDTFNALEAVDVDTMNRILEFRDVREHIYRINKRLAPNKVRISAGHRADLKRALLQKGYPVKDYGLIDEFPALRINMKQGVKPRYPHQDEAIKRFLEMKNGVLDGPPGSGKTRTAVEATVELQAPTLYFTNRGNLCEQVKAEYLRWTDISPRKIATFHSGSKDRYVRDITITTYQMAVNPGKNQKRLINDIWKTKWGLIVFDECLPYDSSVLLSDGTTMPIGTIVEEQLPVEVMAMNPQGELVPRKVTRFYKIPLYRQLVEVHHDYGILRCTEDHKVFTDEGYIPASGLRKGQILHVCGDTLYRVPLQEVWETVSNPLCVRWALRHRPQPGKSIEKVKEKVEEPQSQPRGIQETERTKVVEDAWREQPQLKGESNHDFNTRSNADYLRGLARRYECPKRQAHLESPTKDWANLKESRVRKVVVLSVEESRKYTAEDCRERGMGGQKKHLFNKVTPMLHSNIRGSNNGRSETSDGQVALNDSLSAGISSMAHGRWVPERSEHLFTYRGVLDEGGRTITKLAGRAVGHRNDSISQPRISFSQNELRGHAQIQRTDQGLHSELHGIQNYVYDIEVEGDHNFFADGVLVSNCQHIPADLWRQTAERIQTLHKLGLTATPVREDKKEAEIFSLIGPPILSLGWLDMAEEGYIADAVTWEVLVGMTPSRRTTYTRSRGFNQVVLAASNPEKIRIVKKLLEKHARDPALIIGYYKDGAKEMAKEIGARLVSGDTPMSQREPLYESFRRGEIDRLVLTQVGEEGVDLPNARVAINIAGLYGSRMGFSQRLGRILRPKEGTATFYELVTVGTVEEEYSERRRAYLVGQGYDFETLDMTEVL